MLAGLVEVKTNIIYCCSICNSSIEVMFIRTLQNNVPYNNKNGYLVTTKSNKELSWQNIC